MSKPKGKTPEIGYPMGSQSDSPGIPRPLGAESANETVARYSVLKDRKQIFASRYMLCLPTEEQLRREVEKERRLIETAREETGHE